VLHEPSKLLGGYRQYSLETVKRVRFIKRAQTLGITLEEIAGLLAFDETKACLETRDIAAQKLSLIKRRISDLSRMKKTLSRLVHSCDASSVGEPCPIIDLLVVQD
jgi:MerR family mercuric resistance operon transcriptional regulator